MKNCYSFVVLALLLSGCAQSVDEVAVEKSDKSGHEFSVIATRGDQSTRVTFADEQTDQSSRQLVWENEDRIAIGFSSDEFASTNTFSIIQNDGATALFNGIISTMPIAGDKVAAIYPYDENATFYNDYGDITVNASIAEEQDGNSLGLMVAAGEITGSGTSLSFKSAAPLLGIELTNSGSTYPTLNKVEVCLADMSGEWLPLAGETTITIAEDGSISTYIDSDGATTVSVACDDKMTAEKVAKYIAIAHVSEDGGTIRIIASLSNGKRIYKQIDVDELTMGKLYTTAIDIATCSECDEENISEPWRRIYEVTTTAGGLESAVNSLCPLHSAIVGLTVKGTVDKSDFDFIKESLNKIETLNFEQANIAAGEESPANTIPVSAFSDMSTLISVRFGNNVTEIGGSAFYFCSSLKSVSVPAAKTISKQSFGFCTSLESISFPNVTTLSERAFYSCSALKSVSLGSAETIGTDAFNLCKGLQSVSLDSAKSIGKGAFEQCTSLKTVSLPVVTTIGDNAFRLTALTSVDFPEATDMGSNAFISCSSLTSVSLPKVTNILDYSFQYCTALKDVLFSAATSIGNNSFENCRSLESVSFPEAVTVGNNAFASCTSLNSVLLPKATTFGDIVFYSCGALKSVSFPSATTFTNSTFYYCNGLETVSFNGLTTVTDNLFAGHFSLKSVSLPAATIIGSSAFNSCTNLTSVSAPKAITIRDDAFGNCTGLTSISLPEALQIESSSFNDCSALESVTFSKAQTIGNGAFNGCTGLKSVLIPEALQIESYSFKDCSALESVSFSKVKTIGDGVFYNCTGLTSVLLPEVTTIGTSTFDLCSALTSVSLPKATTIGDYVFSGCSNLTSASLPNATSIGDMAFADCKKLTSITFEKLIDLFGAYVFMEVDTPNCSLTISNLEEYDATNKTWRDYEWKSISTI